MFYQRRRPCRLRNIVQTLPVDSKQHNRTTVKTVVIPNYGQKGK